MGTPTEVTVSASEQANEAGGDGQDVAAGALRAIVRFLVVGRLGGAPLDAFAAWGPLAGAGGTLTVLGIGLRYIAGDGLGRFVGYLVAAGGVGLMLGAAAVATALAAVASPRRVVTTDADLAAGASGSWGATGIWHARANTADGVRRVVRLPVGGGVLVVGAGPDGETLEAVRVAGGAQQVVSLDEATDAQATAWAEALGAVAVKASDVGAQGWDGVEAHAVGGGPFGPSQVLRIPSAGVVVTGAALQNEGQPQDGPVTSSARRWLRDGRPGPAWTWWWTVDRAAATSQLRAFGDDVALPIAGRVVEQVGRVADGLR